ncbi:hypothetical protein BDV29DRAFT_186402 [Aspergillus leporis]|jgi:thiamine kinase-like enzyme|uniref:Aminoglycoside phosphotransferase domain-containing protein n=1 Tax=Aspergillus leporis TaxID=41062 RepID=A0A5N5WHY6_9EURO|nr:hypothetical protein BDV29DRAFT_186402 [Aspergillus leporis]
MFSVQRHHDSHGVQQLSIFRPLTYVKFLRSLLKYEDSTLGEVVFTHGDVRTDNIMVKQDTDINRSYVVTGIIDWVYSDFYPTYYEYNEYTAL